MSTTTAAPAAWLVLVWCAPEQESLEVVLGRLERTRDAAVVVMLGSPRESAADLAVRHGGRVLVDRAPLQPGLLLVPHDHGATYSRGEIVIADHDATQRLEGILAPAAQAYAEHLIVLLIGRSGPEAATASAYVASAGGTLVLERARAGFPPVRRRPRAASTSSPTPRASLRWWPGCWPPTRPW